jgi:NAD+ synthase
MNRITDYNKVKTDIVKWLGDYILTYPTLKSFVVGVSGGIDSAVVATLCAETGIPTYVLSMPLHSSAKNDILSDEYSSVLEDKYPNVTKIRIDLSSTYDQIINAIEPIGLQFVSNQLANANTKSRIRMVTLYQIAGSVNGIVVGTGNKVEDYGVGFYTKYGDGGVDIAPIADLYKTEVWELGRYLGVDQRIIDAPPTDGLWEDSRSDEDQIGASYAELEEAMEYGTGPALEILKKFNAQNKHKMESIPTFKL